MVQCLELCTLTNEGPGHIPDWGTKIPQAAQSDGQKKNQVNLVSSHKLNIILEDYLQPDFSQTRILSTLI